MQSELLLNIIDEQEAGPSFFELFIMDQMYAMLKPALRHVYQSMVLQAADPDQLMDYFDPVYTVLITGLEALSIFSIQKQASIMESLYGYQRVSDGSGGIFNRHHPNSSSSEMNTIQKSTSILYILLIPKILILLQHIKEYAREIYANSTEADILPTDAHFTQRWLSCILSFTNKVCKAILYYTTKTLDMILPHVLALEAVAVTCMKMLYILKLTPYHHPLFAALGMRLVKQRLIQLNPSSTGPAAITIQSTSTSSSSSAQRSWHLTAIMAVIFAIRGVDWLVNTDHHAEHLSHRVVVPPPPPPPPQPIKIATNGLIPHHNTRLCPICGKERKNPCAASSGYVFCYLCIFAAVRDTQQCPVTKLPCSEKDLIRLYENLNS